MNPTLPHAPSWSEQTDDSTCSWSRGNHQGLITLSSMREAARNGCVRCKLLLRGIEKYTFPPFRPYWTTEATLSEYESDPGLELTISVFKDNKTPLRVTVQYSGMFNELRSLPIKLSFYTHPDKPPYFSDVQTAGHIPADPASQACISTVKEWIRRCDDLHPQCLPKRDASTTPTRLISVGLSSDDIKLCRSSEVPADVRYVALSHAWGVIEERRKPMPLLLTENVSARRLGIPLNELTQTFQDAITITRDIGIPYIWIDSLCIVQDDREDWAKEAARMASVYKSAYLVIAATSSKNGDYGCLHPRSPSYDLAGPSDRSFHVQRMINHHTIVAWKAGDDSRPLLDRAWCFQERLLACRVLHYTEEEMMWECQDELWCECQTIKLSNPSTVELETFQLAHAIAAASMNPRIRAESWDKVVSRYSQRALTFGTDRLPGISGIARELALPAMGRYLAGLWEYQLPQALLWQSTGKVIDRPSQYLAPTWSWASIVTGVLLFGWQVEAKSTTSVCRAVDITCTPNTSDLYGHVRDGQLKISGPTMAATLKRTDREYKSSRYDVILEIPNTEGPEGPNVVHMTSDIELLEDTVQAVILLIQVRSCSSYSTMGILADGLALIHSKTHTECWERIGYVYGYGLDLSQMKEKEFMIV